MGWGANLAEAAELEEARAAESAAQQEAQRKEEVAAAERARQEEAAAAEAAKREQELSALRSEVESDPGAVAASIRAEAEALREVLRSNEGWEQAHHLSLAIERREKEYEELGDLPSEVAAAQTEAESAHEAASVAFVARKRGGEARQLIEKGKRQVRDASYWDGNLSFEKASKTLEAIDTDQRRHVDRYRSMLNEAKKLHQSNRRRADRQLKQVSEAAALRVVCGENPPQRYAWDGSLTWGLNRTSSRWLTTPAASTSRVAPRPSSPKTAGRRDATTARKMDSGR